MDGIRNEGEGTGRQGKRVKDAMRPLVRRKMITLYD